MKPVLKWAGGKYKIRQQILSLIDNYENYWEPFLGSASVAIEVFNTKKCEIFLSDINDDLINFYIHLKESPKELIFKILIIQFEFSLCDKLEKYMIYRERFNSLKCGDLERSVIFYFLNKTAFNGLMRYNSKGEYNVPFGQREFSSDVENLFDFSQFLNSKNVHLSKMDYKEIAPNVNDFVYLDPPYHPLNKTSNFTSYHKSDWSEKDEYELKDFCNSLVNDNVHFVLSNNDVPFIRNLFSDFDFHSFEVRKSVGAKKETRKMSPELLIYKK